MKRCYCDNCSAEVECKDLVVVWSDSAGAELEAEPFGEFCPGCFAKIVKFVKEGFR